MSGKRYVDAFDEEIVGDSRDDECVEFLSDDEEYESSDEDQPVVEEIPYDHIKHVEQLNEREHDSLEACHEAIKDKLNWVSSFDPTPRPIAPIAVAPRTAGKPRSKPSLKFGKGVPMKIDVVVGGYSGITVVEPVSDKPCRYITSGQMCPFGEKCRFSHNVQPRACNTIRVATMCKHIVAKEPCPFGNMCRFSHEMRPQIPPSTTTASGHTKKIWMCKKFVETKNCRYGSACTFAHTPEEVEKAVRACNRGTECGRVKKINGKYVNVGDIKCNRRHPGELISNFITRTS